MHNIVELKQPEVTICTQCEHFMNREPTGPRTDIWYNHFCLASPLPKKVNPYNGALQPCDVNDLGGEYFTSPDEGFKNCRYVNDGKCPKFSRKLRSDSVPS